MGQTYTERCLLFRGFMNSNNVQKSHHFQTGMYKYVHRRGQQPSQPYPDIPQTPLPENIKYLGLIQIRHFDAKVMAFLGQIRPLLTDVDIDTVKFQFSFNQESLTTILGHKAPMLDGIHSLGCEQTMLPRIMQFCDKPKVLKITPRGFGVEENVDFIMNWLNQGGSSSNDGPRMCEFHFLGQEVPAQISAVIRQKFYAAKTPSTFVVNLIVMSCSSFWDEPVAEFHLENTIGEHLHGVRIEDFYDFQFRITRHPANDNMGLQEWINANAKQKGRGRIELYNSTIGSIDAGQMDLPRVDEEQDVQEKPCSSKDA